MFSFVDFCCMQRTAAQLSACIKYSFSFDLHVATRDSFCRVVGKRLLRHSASGIHALI